MDRFSTALRVGIEADLFWSMTFAEYRIRVEVFDNRDRIQHATQLKMAYYSALFQGNPGALNIYKRELENILGSYHQTRLTKQELEARHRAIVGSIGLARYPIKEKANV